MVCGSNKQQRVHVIRSLPYIPSSSLSSDHKEAAHHKSHPRHTLDVFVPAEAYNPASGDAGAVPEKLPVVLHCHGGGWMRGNSSSEWRGGPVFGRWAAQNRTIAVVINYRLSRSSWPAVFFRSTILSLLLAGLSLLLPPPIFHETLSFPIAFVTVFCTCLLIAAAYSIIVTDHATHPHHVHDVAAAIRWVQDHLHEVCPLADTSSGIILSGHSAGAHLVSLVSLDPSFLLQHGVQPSFIKGVVSVSGVYSLWAPLHRDESNFRNAFFRLFYARAAFGSDPTVWRAASPIQHVESRAKFVPPKSVCGSAPEGLPRFLVLSAASDLGLEVDGERFVAALRRHGFDVQYFTVSGTSHASIASKFHQHSAAKHVQDFLSSFELGRSRPVSAEMSENTPAA